MYNGTMRTGRPAGNVFRDLGFAPAEAENLRVRAELMLVIENYLRREGLTQAEAAKRFGLTQPRISDLKRGRIDLFSVDGLMEMLGKAGLSVRIRVERPRAA